MIENRIAVFIDNCSLVFVEQPLDEVESNSLAETNHLPIQLHSDSEYVSSQAFLQKTP